jgi:hypothetical protein
MKLIGNPSVSLREDRALPVKRDPDSAQGGYRQYNCENVFNVDRSIDIPIEPELVELTPRKKIGDRSGPTVTRTQIMGEHRVLVHVLSPDPILW